MAILKKKESGDLAKVGSCRWIILKEQNPEKWLLNNAPNGVLNDTAYNMKCKKCGKHFTRFDELHKNDTCLACSACSTYTKK